MKQSQTHSGQRGRWSPAAQAEEDRQAMPRRLPDL